jgi:hypothetical protein
MQIKFLLFLLCLNYSSLVCAHRPGQTPEERKASNRKSAQKARENRARQRAELQNEVRQLEAMCLALQGRYEQLLAQNQRVLDQNGQLLGRVEELEALCADLQAAAHVPLTLGDEALLPPLFNEGYLTDAAQPLGPPPPLPTTLLLEDSFNGE